MNLTLLRNVLFKNGYIFLLLALIIKLYNIDIPFFWDSITCLSRTSSLLYDNGLQYFIYDTLYDNGDPHILPFYIASIWTLFGKSIWVTHLALLPFAIGCYIQTIRLCQRIFGSSTNNLNPWLFLLSIAVVMSDTSFLSQTIVLGTDVCVIFFALYTINNILKGSRLQLSIGFLGLLVTRRAMLIAASLMIVYAIKYYCDNKEKISLKNTLTMVLPLLPTCIGVVVYISLRLINTGWFFTSDNNVWVGSAELVNLPQFIKNCIVFVWRNIDFGRIVIWGIMILGIVKIGIKHFFKGDIKWLTLMYIVIQFVLLCVTLPLTNSFGARYFIVPIVIFAIIACKIAIDTFKTQKTIIMLSLAIVAQIGSNFVLYPESISTCWDSTLSHLHFYKLRNECLDYLRTEGIRLDHVSSGFSIYGDQHHIFLTDTDEYIDSDIEKNDIYIYSNICNEPDEKINYLHNELTSIRCFSKNGIFINVMRRQ